MHEPTVKYFHIIVKAKLICIQYVIYDVQSNESKHTKIVLTTVWKKGNMIVEGFMRCHWMRKNVTVDFYIWCHAVFRDKYV